ncbi:MAG: 4'-phosphopantetheinyl transferase superfamily protein [Muribaculaceae bacterium]|nr:4'-phosphopantetheinyl transferase superfamily protein [Muribaculaceae bacterium]
MTQLTDHNVTVAVEPVEPGTRADRSTRERAAVRRIVDRLLSPDTVIGHHPDGAPYIDGRPDLYISISHSATHAAVALSLHPATGIDTETWRDQLDRIRKRYLSAAELDRFTTPSQLLTAWCIKEAAYKAARTAGLDLRADIVIDPDHATVTAGAHTLRYTDLSTRLLPDHTECIVLVTPM